MGYEESIRKTCEIAQKHGKAVGIGISEPWKEEASLYMNMGCRFLEIGHDLGVLHTAWTSALSEVQNIR